MGQKYYFVSTHVVMMLLLFDFLLSNNMKILIFYTGHVNFFMRLLILSLLRCNKWLLSRRVKALHANLSRIFLILFVNYYTSWNQIKELFFLDFCMNSGRISIEDNILFQNVNLFFL